MIKLLHGLSGTKKEKKEGIIPEIETSGSAQRAWYRAKGREGELSWVSYVLGLSSGNMGAFCSNTFPLPSTSTSALVFVSNFLSPLAPP